MSTTTSSEQLKRLKALQAKHAAISERLDTALKTPSTADYYLVQLKKQKLLLKDSIMRLSDPRRVANQSGAAG
ncbi:MAG: DUF465 domain-containing protein [Alphaproteobacteria bacterium]|nr:DUF465 domain-containing protein [Alphaproteobacteria bacterium]MCD8520250.1 DUF465 domain-containing protein [Alphaproteobacteria bacterium]MCD8570322.1 DUF465 domain-containing protein [Alphaproteobacteria bacterium]